MPYSSNTDLPASVREHLPEHAQEIYRSAFNSAFEEYKDSEKRRPDASGKAESREEVAHRVAWAAVKEKYEKGGESGKWKRSSER